MSSGNRLKNALKDGRLALGMYVQLGSPALVQIMGYAGFDYAVLDLEHTPYSLESLTEQILASEVSKITPIVRIYENNPALIGRILDLGAKGIVVPHVKSAEHATRAVAASRYPPKGERGFTPTIRAMKYSVNIDPAEQCKILNEETVVIALIEDVEAVNNIREILSIEGLDAVWIGAGDLSKSLGVPGRYDHSLVEEAAMKVFEECKLRGVGFKFTVGLGKELSESLEYARKWVVRGMTMVDFSDVEIFKRACMNTVQKVKDLKEQIAREM